MPARHVKKSVAELLIRRLVARRISKTLIQMVTVRAYVAYSAKVPAVVRWYIPERMPPVDVPGVHFEEPKSPTWREQHRMVKLPSCLTA